MKKEGVRELRELIEAVMDIGIAVLAEFSDGIQLRDVWKIVTKLQNSPEYRTAIGKAYDGSSKIPAELKDVDGEEAIELAMVMLPYLPKLIKAARPKA